MITCINKELEKVLNERADALVTDANARDFIADYVYSGNTNYFDDCINEFADNNVDIYTSDLLDWLQESDNASEYMEQAIDLIDTKKYCFADHIRCAQYYEIGDELHAEIDDDDNMEWLKLWALSEAESVEDLTVDKFDEVIAEALDVDVDIYNDRVDSIIDIMDAIIYDVMEG